MKIVDSQKVKSVYDSLHFIKTIPFEIFWILWGSFIFVVGEILILWLKEPHFMVLQVAFCIGLGVAPLLYRVYHLQFKMVTRNLNVIFGMENEDWKNWIEEEEENIFSLKHRYSKAIVCLLLFFVGYTFLFLPPPFKSWVLNLFSFSSLFFLTLFASLTLQFTVMLLLFLRKLTFKDTVARFYLFPHPELTKLLRYYSSLSIVTSLGYITLVFSIWFSPYGFNTQMLLWLSVLALYPIVLFIWSYFHIHLIQHHIKFSFISLINEQVNDSLMVTLEAKDSENIEKLDKFMTIQSKLHALKEYPFELSGFLTFLATFIVTLIQIYLAVRKP